jgi:hypothetical protein
MFKATRLESDLDALREERQANALPWSQSPFACDARLVNSDPDNELELRPGELIVKAPEEVPWIGKALTNSHHRTRLLHFHLRSSVGNCHDHSICQFNVNTIVFLLPLP